MISKTRVVPIGFPVRPTTPSSFNESTICRSLYPLDRMCAGDNGRHVLFVLVDFKGDAILGEALPPSTLA